MSFDPVDVEALKRRRRLLRSRLDTALAKEQSLGAVKLVERRSAPKTTQFNVRITLEDKAYLAELAQARKATVVEIVAEAIGLLRTKYPSRG